MADGESRNIEELLISLRGYVDGTVNSCLSVDFYTYVLYLSLSYQGEPNIKPAERYYNLVISTSPRNPHSACDSNLERGSRG